MATHRGVPLDRWPQIREEIHTILIGLAKAKSVISYSDLAAQVRTFQLHADSDALAEMLVEISASEERAGRGMLSAIVVYKNDPKMPGPGFFSQAAQLGRDTTDKTACWIQEMKKVYSAHRR